jgi:hypothetical protein
LTEAELQVRANSSYFFLNFKALTCYGSGEDDSSEDFDEVEIIEKVEVSAVTEIGDDN